MRRTLAQIAAGITAPQRYRDGGHVRGPGTATSDSVPAMLSDGEFVVPTDTVRKVGVRRLRDLVDMTHVPTGKKRDAAHFADGGLASSDEFSQLMAAQRAGVKQRADATFRAIEKENQATTARSAAASNPAMTQGPRAGNLVDQIPKDGYAQAPMADGSQDRWSNTETGRNLSNIAGALPAAGTMLRSGRMVGSAIQSATAAGEVGAVAAGGAALRAMSLPAAGAATLAGTSDAGQPTPGDRERLLAAAGAGAGRGIVNPVSVNPALPPPVSPERSPVGDTITFGSSNGITRTGNSYEGPANIRGDVTINGQGPRNGGAISAQNMSAADNLADGQNQGARERLLAAGLPVVSSVQAPTVRNSTNDWAARNALRNAEVSASSIMNRKEWNRGRVSDAEGKVAGFRASQATDLALQQAQPGLDQAAMRENAALTRERLQQAGDTQRTGIRAQGLDDANQINRGRLTLEQIASGYTNRSADRLDRAQAEVESAKTPEAQKSARERLMALAGKVPQNEWGVQVTPTTKNLDGSTTQGSVYRYNKATGETARVDEAQGNAAQAPAKENMVRGQVYQTIDPAGIIHEAA